MRAARPAGVGAFFGLVMGLSVPLWVIASLVDITSYAPFGMSLSTMMVFLPVVVAVALWYRAGGWPAVWASLSTAWQPPRGIGRVVAAASLWPAITLTAFGAAWVAGIAPWPSLTVSVEALLVYAVIFVLLAACEEWGWTTYVTEPLLRRVGPLRTGLSLGIVCAVWHLIPLLQMGRGAIWIIGWALGTVVMRVIMVRAYLATGRSVLTVILMHASVNVCFVAAHANNTTHNQLLVGAIAVMLTLLSLPVRRRMTLAARVSAGRAAR